MASERGGLFLLFLVTTALGGAGGAVGSIAGNSLGRTGLFAGGILGGLLASVLATRFAMTRAWISHERFIATAAGAAIGFLLAASVAVNTLSSPIGPLLGSLLIGAGAVAGAVYGGGPKAP